jgi:hypothetical protein
MTRRSAAVLLTIKPYYGILELTSPQGSTPGQFYSAFI